MKFNFNYQLVIKGIFVVVGALLLIYMVTKPLSIDMKDPVVIKTGSVVVSNPEQPPPATFPKPLPQVPKEKEAASGVALKIDMEH